MTDSTIDNTSGARPSPPDKEVVAVVLAWHRGAAAHEVRVGDEGRWTVGRDESCTIRVDDPRVSREHATITFAEDRFVVEDLDSRNGTYVDGLRVAPRYSGRPRVVRIGSCLLLPRRRVGFGPVALARDGSAPLVGVHLANTWARIAAAARIADRLVLHGETGTGKEIAARRFHEASDRAAGPFVAVNCASIPPELAERLLFGAKKGVYSGATSDAEGYLQAADGGTLFLDEIAELPAEVQAKLLRAIDRSEVLPLGANTPRTVHFGLVGASHADLRAAVDAGTFRADLYYRIAVTTVELPPLRDRPDEIPWHIEAHVARLGGGVEIEAGFVEGCLLRPWPGNVRELLAEVGSAVIEARLREDGRLRAEDLDVRAGMVASPLAGGASPLEDVERVREVLATHGGNVSATARALGVHRTQLRRLLERLEAEAKADRSTVKD